MSKVTVVKKEEPVGTGGPGERDVQDEGLEQSSVCDGNDSAWWRGSGLTEPTSVEVTTYAFDPEKLGVGTGPLPGSAFSSSILVPPLPTPDEAHRYMILLCAMQIPEYTRAVLRWVRIGGTIGSLVLDQAGTGLIPLDLTISTDTFSFVDGDVLFGITYQPNVTYENFPVVDPNQIRSTSTSLYDPESALKYVPPLFPYVPPAGGVFPGNPVSGYGAFSDWVRFSQSNPVPQVIPFEGPGAIYLWASVHQTDPLTRPKLPNALIPFAAQMSREDGFILSVNPMAIYRRIYGAMMFDVSSTKRKFLERPVRFSVIDGGMVGDSRGPAFDPTNRERLKF